MNPIRMQSAIVSRSREVERRITGQPVSDGAGVKLLRVLTAELQRRLDPFLMLDEFRSDNPDDYLAGFPDHPHRGFETVTYMLAGRMRHRDSAGHEGLLTAGGVQWMTAGRGIVHSELPEQEDGLMHGFQLWVNLPARDKLTAPAYRDIPAEDIPVYPTASGATIKVIAGESEGVIGAVRRAATAPLYLDIELPAGVVHAAALPALSQRLSLRVCRAGRGGRARRGGDGPPVGGADQRRRGGRCSAARRGRSAAAANRGPAVARTHRPVGTVRDEPARGDRTGPGRLPRRTVLSLATRGEKQPLEAVQPPLPPAGEGRKGLGPFFDRPAYQRLSKNASQAWSSDALDGSSRAAASAAVS